MAENDPRGGFSLLAPILNPKDIGISSITPEQAVSGEYQIPTISSMEELQQLPPNTSYDYFDPKINEMRQDQQRSDASIPRINLDDFTGEFESLPVGAYFYADGELRRKKLAETSPLARIGQRLIGTDIDARGFGIEIPRIVSTTVGAMTLGNLATKIPVPTSPLGVVIKGGGTIALGGIGAAMGSIMPEQTLEWGEKFGLIPEGTRDQYGYTDEELRTLFVGEGLLDMAFGGSFAALRAVSRPTVQFAARLTDDATQLARQARERGIAMMPVMLGDGAIPRGYVTVMGRFPFFGGPFKKGGELALNQFNEIIKDLPSRFGPLVGINELSTRIFKEGRNLVKAIDNDFGNAYDSIFKRADEAGVKVIPDNTLTEAAAVKEKILASRTMGPDGEFSKLTPQQQSLVNFIDNQILNLRQGKVRTGDAPNTGPIGGARDPETGQLLPAQYTEVPVTLASGEALTGVPQTMASMDGILSGLDTLMNTIRTEQGGRLPDNLGEYYSTLGNSVKGDLVANLVEPAGRNAETGLEMFQRNSQGSTGQLGYELQLLDRDFSNTINALFETSAGKMFQGVRRGGLRGTTKPSQEALQKNVDELVQSFLLKAPKSPATILELRRIVGPDTFRMLGATYLDKAIQNATKDGVLDPIKFRETLGVGNPNSPQAKSFEALLTGIRGGPDVEDVNKLLSMDEVTTLLNIGDAINKLDIPEVSTFIARRAALGGMRSGLGAFAPVAGGVAAGTAASGFGLTGLLGSILFLMGGRGISNMIANPATALPLKEVLEAEAKGINDKANLARVGRGAIRATGASLGYGAERIQELIEDFDLISEQLEELNENPELLENPSEEVVELEESLVPEVEETVAVVEPPPFSPMTQSVPAPPIDVTQLPQQPVPVAQAPVAAPPSPENRAQYAALFPNDMASGIIRSGIGSLV